MENFEVIFLDDAVDFLRTLEMEVQEKVLENIRVSRFTRDPRLFKKLNTNIWEFRTRYGSKQIRFLAFWDKRNSVKTLVVATHGFVKKTEKIKSNDLIKAERLRKEYFTEE